MGAKTGISWTDATWNPWLGCTKVSPGCDSCYMFREQEHYGNDPNIVRRSKTKFRDPLKWKDSRRVFTCSWGDFFHADADAWREEAWDIIRRTPHLTYQILTKRHARIERALPKDWGTGYPNVWLGVSVEDDDWAYRRIPVLMRIPATVRFLSIEPMLGPVDLTPFLPPMGGPGWLSAYRPMNYDGEPLIHWVICGGESGPGHRDMLLRWARSLRDQVTGAGIPFFFKQISDSRSGQPSGEPELDRWKEFPR